MAKGQDHGTFCGDHRYPRILVALVTLTAWLLNLGHHDD